MALSQDLIREFAKVATANESVKRETTLYGTIKVQDGTKYVQIDGSDLLTPISSTADISDGERVTLIIKDHTVLVTGNISAPSAKVTEVEKIATKISEFEIIIADKVDTEQLNAQIARITSLEADNVTIKGNLEAAEADIDSLEADNVTINGKLTAHDASIENLETTKLSAETADLKYANINFSNITEAAVEKLFSDSGIIKDLVVDEGHITGELVGVTIKGDLIEGGTVVADKLVVKGSNGLYYKLNTDGVTTEAEQTEYNSLNGSVITARSITATKISVEDLVAFGATIGGFHITDDSIYSGVKKSVSNTTRGIYLDNDGQIVFGDSDSFVKFYKDDDGKYRLSISADTMSLKIGGTSSTIESAIEDVNSKVDDLKDEITTLLRIESSRGVVFKNDSIATVLSVVIYHGTQRITDYATMKSVFGDGAYLQWKWQRLDDESFGVISSSDPRFGDNGFTFTLSPDDVDTKVTFMCELII